jgi:transcriptional regulator with XRE-family HTH domain
MHDNAPVPLPQVNTTDYSDDARTRLGVAVTRAREAAGWTRRQDLADRANVSKRSLAKLETGAPGVGRQVLEAVGRALPSWTEDTPRLILEGDNPPPTTPMEQSPIDAGSPEPVAAHAQLSEEDKARLEVLKSMIGVEALRDEIRYQLLAYLLEAEGIQMTPQNLITLVSEIERLKAEQRAVSEKVNGGTHRG